MTLDDGDDEVMVMSNRYGYCGNEVSELSMYGQRKASEKEAEAIFNRHL